MLIAIRVLTDFDINPRTWKKPDKFQQASLGAAQGSNKVKVSAWYEAGSQNEFFYLELADHQYNSIDLNFLIANNPTGQKYRTDFDDAGMTTLFGTIRRNLAKEEKAVQAGPAPGQIREGLRCSGSVFTLKV